MSIVSEIEKEISAMPKEFRDWFAEYYHVQCSAGGRQMTDEEIESCMSAFKAALTTQQAPSTDANYWKTRYKLLESKQQAQSGDVQKIVACLEYIQHQLAGFKWHCPECQESIKIVTPEMISYIQEALTPFTQNKGD